jgi:hypothetical protein
MGKRFTKVRMKVSIASADWSYQPQQVVSIESDLAEKWISVGHAERVSKDEPLTDFAALDGLADLSAAEALRHRCSACDRQRARYVIRQKAFCSRCVRAELEMT